MSEPRRDARVAVVGGGVAGLSLLYHLARLGWTDAVLLEEAELTSGTTWHAAGLCTQFSASVNLMGLLRSSVELYSSIEEETGQPVGFHRTGSLRLAETRDRLDEFTRVGGVADLVGVPFEVASPERAVELFPLMDPAGVVGAAYLPTDGWIDPTSLATAYAKGATDRGARIERRRPVTGMERTRAGWRLETPRGDVLAGTVVLAAGQWSPEVARLVGVTLPVVSVPHHYVITEAVPGLPAGDDSLPVLRDPEGGFYVRQDNEGLLVGPFEQAIEPWALDGIPKGFHNRLLKPDLARIVPCLENAARRIPVLDETPIKKAVNGPDGYTPDGRCLMGPVPGLRNFHVLTGFSIFGIVWSGGAGRYAAEWIVEGQPSENMWEIDVSRFGDYARTAYVARRAREVYAREYDIHYPEEERPAGRPLKTDPLYDRLRARGGVFGARFGWERPLWFARSGMPREDAYSFRRGNWHGAVGEECLAVRNAVGVLDQTSFAKFEVAGPGAESLLDRLCANRLPADSGRIALTQLCTPRGGIQADVTVARLADDRFYVVSAAATETHDLGWIEAHAPEDGSVRLENVTARLGVLTLAGPRSRELLQALTRADVSGEAFPFFRCRELELGMAPARVLRVSYAGELGYELHHPLEYQRHLYQTVLEAGEPLGLVDFGYRALESLRLEKCYRLWGADLSADWTPLQAGLERFVAFDKGDFNGRDRLLHEREVGPSHVLSCLVVDAADADAHGHEPVYEPGGASPIAYVASGGFGHTLGLSIALAYLPAAHAQPGIALEIAILGERRASQVAAQPLYDRENTRLLA
jgi:dimethylglycine dehydrogenase